MAAQSCYACGESVEGEPNACPHCGALEPVDVAMEFNEVHEFELSCPFCSQPLTATEDLRGETTACPACEEDFQIPQAESARKRSAPAKNRPKTKVRPKSSRSRRRATTPPKKSNAPWIIGVVILGVAIGVVLLLMRPDRGRDLAQTMRNGLSFGPRIDTSTDETYRKSLETMKKALSAEENRKLSEALQVLALSEMKGNDGLMVSLARMADTDALKANLYSRIDGRSAQEIAASAHSMLGEEIAVLQATKAASPASARALKPLVISEARYYWREGSYRDEPVIAFDIRNEMAVAISHVTLHGLVSTPGRSVSWIDESFGYEFPGGLEPQESQHLELVPNEFAAKWWNRDLKERTDTVLVLRVLNAKDAKGKSLAGEFSGRDAQRLTELRETQERLVWQ